MALSLFYAGRPPVKSEEHRVSLVELFTATWCHYCPAAETAVSQSYAKNSDKFVFIEYHLSDSLSNPEMTERARYYGVVGTPTGIVNGDSMFVGSQEIKNEGLPLAISAAREKPLVTFGKISVKKKGVSIDVSASCKAKGIENPTKFFILLVEDKVEFRSKEYRFVVRDIYGFKEKGDFYFERCNFNIAKSYKPENLYLLFFVQDEETDTIYNAKLVKLDKIENSGNSIGAPKFMLVSQDKNDLRVHVIFSADSSLKKFELQIAKDSNFSKIMLKKILTDKKTEIENLPPGTYYARVRGIEGENKFTDWSDVKTFSVMAKITLQPGNPIMTVNGTEKEIDPGRGTKPVIISKWGRTVVPIRAIVEALGGTIEWDGKERKVTILFNDTNIELWIGKPRAQVNGVMKWIDENNHDVKPIIINGRTMLPLRFVAENLGCTVNWDEATRTITITYTP